MKWKEEHEQELSLGSKLGEQYREEHSEYIWTIIINEKILLRQQEKHHLILSAQIKGDVKRFYNTKKYYTLIFTPFNATPYGCEIKLKYKIGTYDSLKKAKEVAEEMEKLIIKAKKDSIELTIQSNIYMEEVDNGATDLWGGAGPDCMTIAEEVR